MTEITSNIKKIIRLNNQDSDSVLQEIKDILYNPIVTKYLNTQDCVITDIFYSIVYNEYSINFIYKGIHKNGYRNLGSFLISYFDTIEWIRIETINNIIN